jgi:integrase
MTDEAKAEKAKPRRRGRVYQDGERGTWWVDFSRRGRRYRMRAEDARTEREAWDFLEARREEVRQGRRLDIETTPFTALAARLRAHHGAKGTRPRTLARYEQHLAHLEAFFADHVAEEIESRVEAYIAARRKEGAKPGTIKCEVDLLAQAFRVAKLRRLDRPAIEVRNARQGFLEADEVRRVTEHLRPALRPAVWFAFYTGWRKGEVLSLRWKAVDFAAGIVRLESSETKNGRGRVFPFAVVPGLAEVLQDRYQATMALERQTGMQVDWVFHRGGRPIRDMDDAWRTACKGAEVPGRVFHDLRRSAALTLRRAGLSETDIMEVCGWETASMFRRYCVRDETGLSERLRRAVEVGGYGARPAPTSPAHGREVAETRQAAPSRRSNAAR